jgi:hypothetical protein
MRGDIYIDNETLLMTDFVNLKIKSVQPFRCAHINRIYICLFIEVNARKCTVFKKNMLPIRSQSKYCTTVRAETEKEDANQNGNVASRG